jgi:hypothetical protein
VKADATAASIRSDQPVNMRVIARGFGFTVGMVAGLAVMLAVVMKLRSIVRTSRTGTRRSTYTPVTTVEAQVGAAIEGASPPQHDASA